MTTVILYGLHYCSSDNDLAVVPAVAAAVVVAVAANASNDNLSFVARTVTVHNDYARRFDLFGHHFLYFGSD